jgi:hypothetical protein
VVTATSADAGGPAVSAPPTSPPPLPTEQAEPERLAAPAVLAERPTQQEVEAAESIWSLTEFRELNSPGVREYSVRVRPNEQYRWTFSWCATDEARLREILTPLRLDLEIDGIPVPNSSILTYEGTSSAGWPCRYTVTLLSRWQSGSVVELAIRYRLEEAIFDGDSEYPAGGYAQILVVTVEE